MKTSNLVIAIIYTVFYSLIFLSGFMEADLELMFGIILMSPPVVMNWISARK